MKSPSEVLLTDPEVVLESRAVLRPALSAACLCAAAVVPLSPVPARAQGLKRDVVTGYQIAHLTANSAEDVIPRVAPNGLVVWTGRYNLPGATSGSTDYEVFVWDGATIRQITDDDVDQVRPVVNNLGDMAWQVGDGTLGTEIWADIGGTVTQLTNDPAPGVIDRYPDINDAGWVIWGRLLPLDYYVCAWNALTQGPFAILGPGYRPHLSAQSHFHAAGQNGIFDPAYDVVAPMAAPSAFGYREFRRSEINDLDQLALEAERPGSGPPLPDESGPRDILFWDGANMHRIFRSPGPWYGRPDLNASGVIVWEGFGGLPGSRSGGADEEIFVYRPDMRRVIQLTDDDALDTWPTVTADGRIYWHGTGNLPGVPGAQWDREIFTAVATGDADGDGVPDASDNCPLRANPDQSDVAGLDGSGPDGIGDICQCGDVSNDGAVDATDLAALRSALASGQIDDLPGAAKCRVNGVWKPCSLLDLTILRRALDSGGPLLPGLEQTCDATLQPF